MLNAIQIELHVPNFEPVREFYTKLGFVEAASKGDPEYLVMERKGTTLCFWSGNEKVFNHHYFSTYADQTKRGYGVEIVLPIDDIESFYTKIKDEVTLVADLQVRPWGASDFRIVDPFGYYLRITSYV